MKIALATPTRSGSTTFTLYHLRKFTNCAFVFKINEGTYWSIYIGVDSLHPRYLQRMSPLAEMPFITFNSWCNILRLIIFNDCERSDGYL